MRQNQRVVCYPLIYGYSRLYTFRNGYYEGEVMFWGTLNVKCVFNTFLHIVVLFHSDCHSALAFLFVYKSFQFLFCW